MAKRHERTYARRCALQVLYTSEIQGSYPSAVATSEKLLLEEGDLPEYAHRLCEGVEAHRVEIDRMLASTSENWSLARMPIVDRSILRLATFEMAYVDQVPISVSINEAVELAKDFGGGDESPRFVNGVLGRISIQLKERATGGADIAGAAGLAAGVGFAAEAGDVAGAASGGDAETDAADLTAAYELLQGGCA